MLQIHPDSTCDVCLDHYSFTNNAKTPHMIPCGHIFCYECLAQLNHPRSCPLCRKIFRAVHHIKKLHVDRPVPGERETAMPDAWRFVERLSRCARSDLDIPTTETEELIREAQRWLETGNHKELFPEVDATLSALIKYKTGSVAEHRLIRKIQELETQLAFYRDHFQFTAVLDGSVALSPSLPRGNSSGRANGGRDPNSNPNARDPYQRTNIPPMPSRPYFYQTGTGVPYYDDRVVPQDIMASLDAVGGRHGNRSRHRDRNRERNHRRDGERKKDWYKRRRDRHRRYTMGDENVADRTVVSGDQSPIMNALGIQFQPGQGPYAPVAPPVTSAFESARHPDTYPSTSRAAGAPYPYAAPDHVNAPTMATTAFVSGSRRQNYGARTSRLPNHR